MWNDKFISKATTIEPYPLVFGESGVPYLLGDLPGKGKQIRGEVWAVDDVSLKGLDEYEGISKGYYCRRSIPVVITKNGKQSTVKAFVYFKTTSEDELRKKEYQEEYTLNYHQQYYHAIKHILVKQKMYLEESDGKKLIPGN